MPGNAHLPGDVPVYIGKLSTVVDHHGDAPGVIPASAPALPTPRGQRTESRRRPYRIPVGGGTTVIKLNVHPPRCECGYGSRGARAFVINRPGEHVRQRWGDDLD